MRMFRDIEFPESGIFAKYLPNCNLLGSFVRVGEFTSTFVNLPQCISTDAGTTLNVSGLGTFIFDSQIFQGPFALSLLETPVGDDGLAFSFSGFDQNGNSAAVSLATSVPDDALMINFCNSCSCPQSSSMAANANSTSNKTGEELSKGKMVIIINGQHEIKELGIKNGELEVKEVD